MFFGWGRKNLTKQLAQNKAIILNYGYFHIFSYLQSHLAINTLRQRCRIKVGIINL